MGVSLQLRVRSITREAADINSYELVDPAGSALPPFAAGSHIDVHLPGNLVRQYSLCNDPRERHRYVIGVLNVRGGRGGSRTMHEIVRVGDLLTVSAPRNNFPLSPNARRHVLLAGGIGVTPMMAMVETLSAGGADFSVLYCSRTPELTAFRDRLRPHAEAGRVGYYHDEGDPGRGLDVASALRAHDSGTHLYCCGPTGLMNSVKAATAHWPSGSVHFEFFSAPSPVTDAAAAIGLDVGSFHVRLARSGAVYTVPPEKSIVQVLRDNGVECETSCEAGVCGTCRTRFLEGVPEHYDLVLSDEEHEEFVLICCARSKSELLVLDR